MASPLLYGAGYSADGQGADTPTSGRAPYSPVATPPRSSLKRDGGAPRGSASVAASVRFSGVEVREIDGEQVDMRGRNPLDVKKELFRRYFEPYTQMPLLQSPTSARSVASGSVSRPGSERSTPRAGSIRSGARGPGSARGTTMHSAPATPLARRIGPGGRPGALVLPDSPATPFSALPSTHIPSEWGTESPGARARGKAYGSSPLHTATQAISHEGSAEASLESLNELLAKPWTRREVEAAQAWGFFRRLVPHLAIAQLQAPAALLIARCARLHGAILPPMARDLLGPLPLLLAHPRTDVRQAGMCVLGLLWRANRSSHARAELLAAPRVLDTLTAAAAEGDFDALWAVRELAADAAGALALERRGTLKALCSVLRRLLEVVSACAEPPRSGDAWATAPTAARTGSAQQQRGAQRWEVPPNLAAFGPRRRRSALQAGVEGATKGGRPVELAAVAVLVSDCLASLAGASQSAATAMCKRHKAPGLLVKLLLVAWPAVAQPQVEGEASGGGAAGADAEDGAEWDRESSSPAAAAAAGQAPPGSASGDEPAGGTGTAGKAVPPGARAQLQVRDSVLRCLHTLASCGAKEPQEAVKDAVADAEAPLLERLAQVLQERWCLPGCNAAAYLLWLCASGDFDATPASSQNQLRARLAAPAPEPQSGEDGGKDGGGGGGGDGGRSGATGLGALPAIAALLTEHLAGWRDADLGDCVAAVRSSVPPPECDPWGGPAPAISTGRGQAVAGNQSAEGARAGGGDAAALGDGARGTAASLQRPAPLAAGLGGQRERGGGSAEGSGGGAPQLPQLRVASAGLLLTPRQSRPGGAAPIPSPQRYADAGSSDDEADAGHPGAQGEQAGPGDSHGTAVTDAPTVAAQEHDLDMDLSNIIDSSVELTGKEQVMRAIQAAAQAIARQDAEGMDGQPGAAAASGGGAEGVNGAEGQEGPHGGQPQQPSGAVGTPDGAAGLPNWEPHPASEDGEHQGTGPSSVVSAAAPIYIQEPRYTDTRPPPLALLAASPRGPPPPVPPAWLVARLAALRHIRSRARPQAGEVGPHSPAAVQELVSNCVGLLAAVSLSAAGAKALCDAPGMLAFLASLVDVDERHDSKLPSAADAAASGSGSELRLQLLALLANVCMHHECAAAVAAAASSGGVTLPAAVFVTARLSCGMLRRSATGWATAQQLLEASFTVLANMQRAHVQLQLQLPPERGAGQGEHAPKDTYALAIEALIMPLPGPADRPRVRAAAARMLDSACCAYEAVGRTLPAAALHELLWLLDQGRSAAVAEGRPEGRAAAAPRGSAADKASCAAAGALWQLLSANTVHPDAVSPALQPAVIAILRSPSSSRDLCWGAAGLVSCLARSRLLSRRMWTSPLLPAVRVGHARAKASGDEALVSAWLDVCQQLLRACYTAEPSSSGIYIGHDSKVDRWELAEPMLKQIKRQLEWDKDEEAIVLAEVEEEDKAEPKAPARAPSKSADWLRRDDTDDEGARGAEESPSRSPQRASDDGSNAYSSDEHHDDEENEEAEDDKEDEEKEERGEVPASDGRDAQPGVDSSEAATGPLVVKITPEEFEKLFGKSALAKGR